MIHYGAWIDLAVWLALIIVTVDFASRTRLYSFFFCLLAFQIIAAITFAYLFSTNGYLF